MYTLWPAQHCWLSTVIPVWSSHRLQQHSSIGNHSIHRFPNWSTICLVMIYSYHISYFVSSSIFNEIRQCFETKSLYKRIGYKMLKNSPKLNNSKIRIPGIKIVELDISLWILMISDDNKTAEAIRRQQNKT